MKNIKKNNINILIKDISQKFGGISDQTSLEIIQAITNKNKLELFTQDILITDLEQAKITDWANKYNQEHMPLQYLVGSVQFIDYEIFVEPPILIPRPETEYWCAELIEKLKKLKNKKINILDIGTGSGCIAIALASALPEANIYAIDISDKAIALTKKNITLNKINNITLIKSDLFINLSDIKFDLIVSNPPYIDESLFENLDPSVKNWEDPGALICHDKGLALIKQIIIQSKLFLNTNPEFEANLIPQLVIEIDYTQESEVTAIMQKHGFINIEIHKDSADQDRLVTGSISQINAKI